MKTKVSELTEEKLAGWTARAQEWELIVLGAVGPSWVDENFLFFQADYRPDINGEQAMELQERYRIDVIAPDTHETYWSAWSQKCKHESFGKTPQEAICRAVVASVYGEYVEE